MLVDMKNRVASVAISNLFVKKWVQQLYKKCVFEITRRVYIK